MNPLIEDFKIKASHEATNTIIAALRVLQAHILTEFPFKEFHGGLVWVPDMEHFNEESDTNVPTAEDLEELIDAVFAGRLPEIDPKCAGRLPEAAPPTSPLTKFLVISYDDDEQCSYFDHVAAADVDAAKQIVDSARSYAVAVDALDQTEVDLLGKYLRENDQPHATAYDLARAVETDDEELAKLAIEALPGRRYRLLVADSNCVERGEVKVPVGHCCTIGEYDHGTDLYTVKFDDNAAGEDMGHCLYTLEEIHTHLEPNK